MLTQIIKNLLSSSSVIEETNLTNIGPVVVSEENVETAPTKVEPQYNDPEVIVLVHEFGPMEDGKVIQVSLQQMLKLLPRVRRRKDAYKRLVNHLLDAYGVKLVIVSRKHGKMDEGRTTCDE